MHAKNAADARLQERRLWHSFVVVARDKIDRPPLAHIVEKRQRFASVAIRREKIARDTDEIHLLLAHQSRQRASAPNPVAIVKIAHQRDPQTPPALPGRILDRVARDLRLVIRPVLERQARHSERHPRISPCCVHKSLLLDPAQDAQRQKPAFIIQ